VLEEPDDPVCGSFSYPPSAHVCASRAPDHRPENLQSSTPNWVRVMTDGNRVEMDYEFVIAGNAPKGLTPAINGNVSVETIPEGDQIEFCQNRDPYPSLEVYQFVNGAIRKVLAENELPMENSLWPSWGALSPVAPRNTGCFRS